MPRLWPFNKYPGTDYETFNWEWILHTVKTYTQKVDDFIEYITNTWNDFRDDITGTWNDFKNWTTGEIDQMHDDFAEYVNVTEGALNTGAIANGAITEPKINSDFLPWIKNTYITPKMFGAVGDGVTIDNEALNECFQYCVDNGYPCDGEGLTYLVDNSTESYLSHYGVTVPGGITLRNIHIKLDSSAGDFLPVLNCKYDDNNFLFENCTFEGYMYTGPVADMEDGGSHGLFITDGVNKFPDDWQDGTGKVIIRNCEFKNIRSYGVFMSPINNDLIVEHTKFACHGPALLTSAVNAEITDCDYEYLSESNSTIRTLAIDEIEEFASCRPLPKKIDFKNCTSSQMLYKIQQLPQRGVKYDSINIQDCYAYATILQVFEASGYTVPINNINIENCRSESLQSEGWYTITLERVANANIVLDNIRSNNANWRLLLDGGKLYMRNCPIKHAIRMHDTVLDLLQLENCTIKYNVDETAGYFTSYFGSTYATITSIVVNNCVTETNNRIFYNINCANYYVNGYTCTSHSQLLYNQTAQDGNLYVTGLLMPTGSPDWIYFVENLTNGVTVIQGISPKVNTNNAGTVTKDLTTF